MSLGLGLLGESISRLLGGFGLLFLLSLLLGVVVGVGARLGLEQLDVALDSVL